MTLYDFSLFNINLNFKKLLYKSEKISKIVNSIIAVNILVLITVRQFKTIMS